MPRRLRYICTGISTAFGLWVFLFLLLSRPDAPQRYWIYALCAALVSLALQLVLWAISREKNLITYAMSFIPACALAAALATQWHSSGVSTSLGQFFSGPILSGPWGWACLYLFFIVILLAGHKWPGVSPNTERWLGTACFLVIFAAFAGVLYTLL